MAGKAGKRVYKTKQWQIVRQQVFARDNWRCVKCGRMGILECDHIESIQKGGDWFRLNNLQTLCRGCHIGKTRQENRKGLPSAECATFLRMATDAP